MKLRAEGDGNGTGGEGQENWLDSLPSKLRDHGWINKYDSPRALAEAHVQTVREVRRRPDPDNVVIVPGEDADDEARAKFRQSQGIPGRAEDYDFGPEVIMDPARPDLPAVRVNPDDVATMRKLAHDNDLSQKQAKAIWDQLVADGNRRRVTSEQERQQAHAASRRKLEETFGDQLDEKQKMISVPRSMFVLDAEGKEVEERANAYKALHEREFFPGGLGSDPDYIAYQISVGEHTGADRFVQGSRPSGPGSQNGNAPGAGDADAHINAMYDPANAGKGVDLSKVTQPGAGTMKMPWNPD